MGINTTQLNTTHKCVKESNDSIYQDIYEAFKDKEVLNFRQNLIQIMRQNKLRDKLTYTSKTIYHETGIRLR